ncbi:hypothetical protein TREMEDRAFT_63399 [Tremella mesenterica DSM 1558]|uniref:uncharacterized protein n=1 Tax=Tremella mesenterica (strain ATCC 24925 / CBS 8224 / DSM 1558 / NBRC 9311 / NRRL Y-6157 / RJB 2259-6 / UBC 559-6) TaxID=578456 RepID=UPI0003F4A612|nr:uncharacterized protein TREMEDRAFT_63399 [Tremella mesenterica DSM 1558]EIW68233.1 hypothetical protein TREMEDRAFT_63399 [Tremella mesenterica DSM 1558]
MQSEGRKQALKSGGWMRRKKMGTRRNRRDSAGKCAYKSVNTTPRCINDCHTLIPSTCRNQPKSNVYIKGVKLTALWDTGATCSYISPKAAKRIKKEKRKYPAFLSQWLTTLSHWALLYRANAGSWVRLPDGAGGNSAPTWKTSLSE